VRGAPGPDRGARNGDRGAARAHGGPRALQARSGRDARGARADEGGRGGDRGRVRALGGAGGAGGMKHPATVHDSAWRAALSWWALTRPTLLLAGLLGILLIGYGPTDTVTSWRAYPNSTLANLPARWDTFFYLDIATHGY